MTTVNPNNIKNKCSTRINQGEISNSISRLTNMNKDILLKFFFIDSSASGLFELIKSKNN